MLGAPICLTPAARAAFPWRRSRNGKAVAVPAIVKLGGFAKRLSLFKSSGLQIHTIADIAFGNLCKFINYSLLMLRKIILTNLNGGRVFGANLCIAKIDSNTVTPI
jgi:hypothetical protein